MTTKTTKNTTSTKTTNTRNPDRSGFWSRGKHWPFVIVGMLLFHASIMVGTIIYVSSKHDTWVQPDYYAKAIDWDNQRKLQQNAADLGWSIDLTTRDHADATRELMVTLTDAQGEPIEGALVEVQCVQPAQLDNRLSAVLPETAQQGVYAKPLALQTAGYWQASLSIRYQGTQALINREFKIN